MKILTTSTALLGGVLLASVAGAQELPGNFEGVTIEAKLIGGQQYEALYARIAEWDHPRGSRCRFRSGSYWLGDGTPSSVSCCAMKRKPAPSAYMR